MTLEYALNKNGIKTNDVNFDTSIDFASTTGAFIGGTGDFVSVFEPTASDLEEKGYGKVVASIGQLGGNVPYTSYITKKSFVEKNGTIVKGFTKAIQRGLDYVKNHTDKEVADVIKDYFPDTKLKDIEKIVKKYREIDAWKDNTTITKDEFNHIEEIIDNAGKLEKKAPYSKLVLQ